MELDDNIFGVYKKTENEFDSVSFSNEFILKLHKKDKLVKFEFIMTTKGNFGKVGKDWYGKGVFRNDHFALIIEEERDWTYVSENNEITEYLRKKNEILPIELYTEERKVIVYHKNFNKYITLLKNDD
ncbi:MAG: hypothetical protein U9Q83_09925 [Bacteroidota bacterium]|nr:hypothetical protein [Bacteroidota bacterium]